MSESEERISRAKAKAAKRLANTGRKGTVVTVVLASFEAASAKSEGKRGSEVVP